MPRAARLPRPIPTGTPTKLCSVIPRSVGQLPDYYYQKPAAKREYLGASTLPLFPFGWGLSYTTFKYANLRMEPATIGPLAETTVSVDITNTGSVRGDEVAQLYIRQDVKIGRASCRERVWMVGG